MRAELNQRRGIDADVLLTHSYHLPHDRSRLRKMQPYRAARHALRRHRAAKPLISRSPSSTPCLTTPFADFANGIASNIQPKIVGDLRG